MTPNISPPVDRSPEAMQGISHRTNTQSFTGGVDASGFKCTLCMTACKALSPTPRALCEAACNATVC